MDSIVLKITLLCLFFTAAALNKKTVCMESPRAELAAYRASYKNLSDKDLVSKYQKELNSLSESFDKKISISDNSSLRQLPIFRIAILKAIVHEIKNREVKEQKSLVPTAQLQFTDKLIKDTETKMKIKEHK